MTPQNTAAVEAAVARGANFEITIADMARRSERRAWMISAAAVLLSVTLAGGYYYMLPLHEKVPYLVLADPYSGTSSIARLTDDLINRRITTSEAINRSNIAHFVIARESYDRALTNMRDWPTVLTMASEDVATPYLQLHSAGNKSSPYKRYGDGKAIRIKVLSTVLVGRGPDGAPDGATIRFQRSLYDKSSGATSLMDNKIATMAFAYKANLTMDDQSRIENPLGFQVTSYRVDNDYSDAVPPEVSVTHTESATENIDSTDATGGRPKP